ncbi:MAG TPA: hypothetical protein EYO33_07510 [Phycisphaerales bacterium]|nr:hypothetical protein [Phycisphaerales bacterium]
MKVCNHNVDDADIKRTQKMAKAVSATLSVIEGSLFLLQATDFSDDEMLRQMLLASSTDLAERAADLADQLSVFGERKKPQTEPLQERPEFFEEMAGQLASFAKVHRVNGIQASDGGLCVFAHGDVALHIADLLLKYQSIEWDLFPDLTQTSETENSFGVDDEGIPL